MNCLVILAGGMSSRMKADKALLPIGEEVFLTHAYKNASCVFDEIFISVNDSSKTDKVKKIIPEAVIIEDVFSKIGPINGIYSVFTKTDIEQFAVIPVDCAFMDYRIPFALLKLLSKDAAVYVDKQGRTEPLVGAYSRNILACMEEGIQKGDNRITSILKRCSCSLVTGDELVKYDQSLKEVDFERALMNFNTPEDYRLLR